MQATSAAWARARALHERDAHARRFLTALGATYNLTSALADDKCVRSKFAQYESGCLALGCRGLGDERTYCDAAKLRTTQRPQPPATCDAPGWPVFYSETSAQSQAMRAAALGRVQRLCHR